MNNLNKLLGFVFVLLSGLTSAQDFPYHYFSQMNPMVNNPAFAAFDSEMRTDVGTYNLWAGGFKPLNDYVISFSITPDIKKGDRSYIYESKVGLGAVFLRERIGPFSQNIFQLVYSYHIPLDRSTFFSLGISGSLEALSVNVNSLFPLNPDDPRLLTGNNNAFLIDGGFGAALHGKNYNISISAMNLASGDFQFQNSNAEKINNFRKYFLSANYDLALNRNTFLQPNVTVRNSRTTLFNYDASLSFDFTFFCVGLGYRSENSVFLFTKIPYKNFFFTYNSENPVNSNHMIGNGHTFSVGWILIQ